MGVEVMSLGDAGDDPRGESLTPEFVILVEAVDTSFPLGLVFVVMLGDRFG